MTDRLKLDTFSQSLVDQELARIRNELDETDFRPDRATRRAMALIATDILLARKDYTTSARTWAWFQYLDPEA